MIPDPLLRELPAPIEVVALGVTESMMRLFNKGELKAVLIPRKGLPGVPSSGQADQTDELVAMRTPALAQHGH